ncbi:TonB-dependent receptor [uncultured Rikenella sp.]|uniref:TonB-dependent receptor n=1 Tax=uncultured Rikenella sp. TaxID=368003 RepID=UPI0026072817|nr:TonB-dependent receptor [uncultured Rikenella sp.]
MIRFLTLLLLLAAPTASAAGIVLRGTVTDRTTGKPQDYALVQLFPAGEAVPRGAITDAQGAFVFSGLAPGDFRVKVAFLGFRDWECNLHLTRDTTLRIRLAAQPLTAQEVVVTAKESKGATSASRIDRQAMEHIQPSSFSDLLSLLPGGLAATPRLGTPNLIKLREAGNSSDDYDISSLGTAFMMDGVPISTDANLQAVPGSTIDRSLVSRGLDMRSIPTDNIESVEIVRGIPSVEYGNLTSGLVNIKRRATATPFEGRFKADEYGKLISLGKGIALRGDTRVLNLDGDYLSVRSDPRNTLANYRRITGSLRYNSRRATDRGSLRWRLSLDYTGSLDQEKTDADASMAGDRFKASYNRFALATSFNWVFFDAGAVKTLDVTASLAQEFSRMEQTEQVYLNRAVPLPIGMVNGEERDAELLPYRYTADVAVDGRPMNAFVKAVLGLGGTTGGVQHTAKAGVDWKYDKNWGRGQIYDITRPLVPTNTNRPRPFRDIPAGTELSLFAEDALRFRAGEHRFVVTAGLRATMPLNIAKGYEMHGRVYLDPRVNVQWKLPSVGEGAGRWNFELAGGVGQHTKTPTLDQLYPDPIYADLVQLNYYPANPDLRRINVLTYVWDNIGFDLRPARNLKWEVRFSGEHRGADFSVTYFQERMRDGFRMMAYYRALPYKKYDASAIDPATLAGPPDLAEVPYADDTLLNTYGRWANGSRIDKRGVEFQFSTPRIESFRTRITVNGAWFRTTYSNSAPIYRSATINLGGDPVRYVGLYDWEEGSVRQQFNTNMTFDTYLERLGLTFSTTFQCLWFTSSRPLWNDGVPVAWVDASGTEHRFTEADRHDAQRQWLVQTYPAGYFDRSTVPFAMDVNLKATKHFGRWARLAMYVNRLFSAYPDYYRNGTLVRRSASPYFGMELNLTF